MAILCSLMIMCVIPTAVSPDDTNRTNRFECTCVISQIGNTFNNFGGGNEVYNSYGAYHLSLRILVTMTGTMRAV